MNRKTPLLIDEAYHVFNRGAHKLPVFTNEADHQRYMALLYLANTSKSINLGKLFERKYARGLTSGIFGEEVDKELVEVLAFALLPNHFHLVLRQKAFGGIAKFMQKVSTGYSMYFNTKYGHAGTLWQGRFKSNHLDTDPYFKWIFPYVHLNPISIVEQEWKEKGIAQLAKASDFLKRYLYSSYYDYYVGERPERAILAYEETVGLLDTRADMLGLLDHYQRGSVLFGE